MTLRGCIPLLVAAVLLASPRYCPQQVERLPRYDADQVGARVAHLGPIDVGPPQPGLLHHVLGVDRRSEHLVGNGEEEAAVGDERVGHWAEARCVDGSARGARPQAAANP